MSTRNLAKFAGASALLAGLTSASNAGALKGEASFTPTGLRLPIMRIGLGTTTAAGVTSEQVLWTCPHATEAECLFDVTDQSELDALAAKAAASEVATGTYDTISLHMCRDGSPGGTPAPGFVRGTFAIASEGKTYATDADPSSVTGIHEIGGSGVADFTAIGNWGCGTKSVKLPAPVTVAGGAATPVSIVVDSTLLAFSTPNVSPGMGGCRGPGRGICVSYPSIAPLVGEEAPAIDRFFVSHHRTSASLIDDSKANAYVVVLRSASTGAPLTAFVRPYFSETSAWSSSHEAYDPVFGGPGYFGETLVSSVHVSTPGGLAFMTGSDLDENAAIFTDFRVAAHTSAVETRATGTWRYRAIPLP